MTPELEKGITATHQAIRKGLPNAKIVDVAPILVAEDSTDSLTDVKPAVKNAVESIGGTYIFLGAPLGGHPELTRRTGCTRVNRATKRWRPRPSRLSPCPHDDVECTHAVSAAAGGLAVVLDPGHQPFSSVPDSSV